MRHIFYTFIYLIIYLISLLPLKILNGISYIIYLVGWKIIGYRRSIIIQNISRSFPQAKYSQINSIADNYATHLVRIMAEWLKSFSESQTSILKRISLEGQEYLSENQNRDTFLVLGHFGNWEILNIISLLHNRPVYAIYTKQSSKMADFLSHKMRCRFGIQLLEKQDAARYIMANKTPSIYIFIADQSPSHQSKTTLMFLNQQTLVFDGIERLSKHKNGEVLYTEILPHSDNKHIISFKKIDDNRNITNSFFKALESSINTNPHFWLWSHRRWKHTITLLLILTISTSMSFAQKVKISGSLIDGIDKVGVEYATVVLYRSVDSSYVIGGLSDSIGHFSIEALRGDYFLEVNHINYQRYYHKIGSLEADTTLNVLSLSLNVLNISGVEVVGYTPSVRFTDKKSVYKVSDIPASASGSLIDILKKIPTLTFDFNESVLINGTPASFFVDGRKVTPNELNAYSPTQIVTIEIVSNPTAQYDADGLSGIIELRTKRNTLTGLSGSVNLSGTHDMQTGSANVSYNRGKLSLSSAFSIWNNYQHGYIETRTSSDTTTNGIQANITNITANAAADYCFNERNTLSASYQYIDFGYSSKDYSAKRTGESDMRGITHQFAAGYNHQFARYGETLKADFYYNETSPQTISRLYYTDERFNVKNFNHNNSFVAMVDYSLPFTENANFEAGVKSHTRNIAIDRTDDFLGAPMQDKFSIRESILAAYVQLNSCMERFNVQFGLRSETNLADKADGSRKWDIFPNLSLDYTANENNLLKLGYTNRVNRPSAADLNPFLLLIDPTSTFKGNPKLKPEYSHNLFIDYINRYEGNDIKLSVYYRAVNNLITKTFTNASGGILYTPINIPTAHFYGIDFSSVQNFGKVLSIQPSAGISSVYIPNGTDKEFRNIHSFNLGLSVGVKLPYNFNIQALGRYSSGALSVGTSSQSAIVQGLAIGLPQIITEFSGSKSFLKNSMTLSLRVTDPFKLQSNGFKVYSDNSQIESIYRMETRFVYLSLSYRFNNFKSSTRKYDDGGIRIF